MPEREDGFYCRCGICDMNFKSNEEWDEHAKSSKHKAKVLAFEKAMAIARYKGEHFNIREFVKKIQEQSKMHNELSDAYAIVEFFELGSLTDREYRKACKTALEYFRKKYGKDDFRFREIFACKQDNNYENTFKVRCLIHCELIGCPHSTLLECEKYMSEIELQHLKGKQCQHCSYLEGVKEHWEEKCPSERCSECPKSETCGVVRT